jgi:prevent-host-death family protein
VLARRLTLDELAADSVRAPWEHVFVLSSNRKGAIAETKIAAAATELGIPVLRPIVEHGRYDLGFEMGDRILRVQCKWGRLDRKAGVIIVSVYTSRLTPSGYVRTSYTEDEIDLVAVYCGELDRCYLLPSTLIAGRRAIHLRLTPPRNGQRAAIQSASDFELPGAVAQWNERPAGSRKVVGSNPTSSTLSETPRAALRLGANQFRDRFGYYMERAAAGDEIVVTRHRRPFVRVSPAQPQLTPA